MSTSACEVDVLSCLPGLECPIAPEVHAQAESAHERTIAWLCATGLAPTLRHVTRLRAARVGWLVARGFPRARAWALQLASDWTALFCLLDDHVEAIASAGAVEARLAGLLAAFDAAAGPDGDPLAAALADLRRRMDRLAPARWVDRFRARLGELFACFTAEAGFRERGAPPALAAYLALREVSVGLHVLFTFTALTEAIDLPAEVLAHPAIASLERRASNVVGWANDILTYEKEVAQGEVLNMVVVLQAAHGHAPREALARGIARHNAEVQAFLAEAAALPSFGEHDAAVARHVAVLRAWIPGHLAWGVETGRYRPRAGE